MRCLYLLSFGKSLKKNNDFWGEILETLHEESGQQQLTYGVCILSVMNYNLASKESSFSLRSQIQILVSHAKY